MELRGQHPSGVLNHPSGDQIDPPGALNRPSGRENLDKILTKGSWIGEMPMIFFI
jgi:hypothetical protein